MKKKIKIFLTFAVIIMLMGSFGYSQGKHDWNDSVKKSPEEMAQKFSDKMKSKLKLTDEQTKKVYDSKLKMANDVRALSDSYKISEMKTFRDKVKERNTQFTEDMKQVLTPDQLKKYNKMMKKMHKKHHRKFLGIF